MTVESGHAKVAATLEGHLQPGTYQVAARCSLSSTASSRPSSSSSWHPKANVIHTAAALPPALPPTLPPALRLPLSPPTLLISPSFDPAARVEQG